MIKNFMESSRVSDEFAAMDGIVDQQIEFIKESGQLSEEALNELTEVLNKHINSENLSKIYTDKLRQEMSDEELAELVKIHQEPVMQQFAEAEKYSRTEEGQKEMYEALTNPTKTPISKERAQLLEGIDSKGLHLTEFTLSTLEKMSDSLETALEKPGTKLTPEQKKQREDMEKLMGAQIKEATQAKLAVMLSHMSEDQLQQFKASLEKGPKQKEVLIKQSASTQVHDESMTGIVAAVQKDQKKDKN